jgi:hypothetical protein
MEARMRVIIFEACRSPEIVKPDTEGIVLSKMFTEKKIDFILFSNDSIWQTPLVITKALIEEEISKPDIAVVHLAMHGDEHTLALRWSTHQNFHEKVVADVLGPNEISAMKGWQQKLIVSGACRGQTLADAFVKAGATSVVASCAEFKWTHLGAFFGVLYEGLFAGQSVKTALDSAIKQFPKYASFRVTGQDRPILYQS